MCSSKLAHPLLISIANISMMVQNKAASHSFLLLVLTPISEFLHNTSRMCSLLEARLFHQCLDIVLKPLKQAAQFGCTISDPLGNQCYCFTPLVSYIADTPEACLVACIRGLTSPVTMAMYRNFGDWDRHQPCTATLTLSQLHSIRDLESDIEAYILQGVRALLS